MQVNINIQQTVASFASKRGAHITFGRSGAPVFLACHLGTHSALLGSCSNNVESCCSKI